MSEYVADTMALVLWLEKRRLPSRTKELLFEAEKGSTIVYIPAIVVAEVGYLSAKSRIDTNLNALRDFLTKFKNFRAAAMTAECVFASFKIDDIPELHDRFIAAEAMMRGARVITNDPVISSSRFVACTWA